ncbi:MAG: pyridoxal phosphate-dependent aminotransferase, partial [Nitrosopumilaceae archaeon]|nr:pyridoxal phosphate-dependent aminotransferase [Nitrosopumilaceae archaeon]
TKPQATFYLLADFNSYSTELHKAGILTSQKLSESLIIHPYHTAIVGGDSLVLERTDFSARMAFVDYDGKKAFDNYLNDKPKTSSEKLQFIQDNAPRVIAGIGMIEKFFLSLQKQVDSAYNTKQDSLSVPS